MRYRIRFAKYGVMRYVGHLDLMRFFQKALNRAKVPLSYSKGYHPHPLISFAAPLSVGVTSGGEYMDIVTEEPIDAKNTLDALNAQMVDGMLIVSVKELSDKAKNAMAAVEAAAYYVYFKEYPFVRNDISGNMSILSEDGSSPAELKKYDTDAFREQIRTFYTNADSIYITKQTKKSERKIDLKPLIYDFHVEDTTSSFSENAEQTGLPDINVVFYMLLSTGSTDNIKPELVMEHFLSSMGITPDAYQLGIHRVDMYRRDEKNELVSL